MGVRGDVPPEELAKVAEADGCLRWSARQTVLWVPDGATVELENGERIEGPVLLCSPWEVELVKDEPKGSRCVT